MIYIFVQADTSHWTFCFIKLRNLAYSIIRGSITSPVIVVIFMAVNFIFSFAEKEALSLLVEKKL